MAVRIEIVQHSEEAVSKYIKAIDSKEFLDSDVFIKEINAAIDSLAIADEQIINIQIAPLFKRSIIVYIKK